MVWVAVPLLNTNSYQVPLYMSSYKICERNSKNLYWTLCHPCKRLIQCYVLNSKYLLSIFSILLDRIQHSIWSYYLVTVLQRASDFFDCQETGWYCLIILLFFNFFLKCCVFDFTQGAQSVDEKHPLAVVHQCFLCFLFHSTILKNLQQSNKPKRRES